MSDAVDSVEAPSGEYQPPVPESVQVAKSDAVEGQRDDTVHSDENVLDTNSRARGVLGGSEEKASSTAETQPVSIVSGHHNQTMVFALLRANLLGTETHCVPELQTLTVGPEKFEKRKPTDLQVEVRDPRKEGDGINPHVTYSVCSTFGGGQHRCCVRRRYKDFLWLQAKLAAAFPGFIVPPLPEKTIASQFGMYSGMFVECRRGDLERFLKRVIAHPEMRRHISVSEFLVRDDELFRGLLSRDVPPPLTPLKEANSVLGLLGASSPGEFLRNTADKVSIWKRAIGDVFSTINTASRSRTGSANSEDVNIAARSVAVENEVPLVGPGASNVRRPRLHSGPDVMLVGAAEFERQMDEFESYISSTESALYDLQRAASQIVKAQRDQGERWGDCVLACNVLSASQSNSTALMIFRVPNTTEFDRYGVSGGTTPGPLDSNADPEDPFSDAIVKSSSERLSQLGSVAQGLCETLVTEANRAEVSFVRAVKDCFRYITSAKTTLSRIYTAAHELNSGVSMLEAKKNRVDNEAQRHRGHTEHLAKVDSEFQDWEDRVQRQWGYISTCMHQLRNDLIALRREMALQIFESIEVLSSNILQKQKTVEDIWKSSGLVLHGQSQAAGSSSSPSTPADASQ